MRSGTPSSRASTTTSSSAEVFSSRASFLHNRNRRRGFRLFYVVQCGRLADPVLNVGKARRAGEANRLHQLCVKGAGVLRAQVVHRVDAEPADDRKASLHARDLEQRALMSEL